MGKWNWWLPESLAWIAPKPARVTERATADTPAPRQAEA